MRNGQTSKSNIASAAYLPSNIASAAYLPSDLLPDRFLVLTVHKLFYLPISTAKSNDERFLQRTPTANAKKAASLFPEIWGGTQRVKTGSLPDLPENSTA